MPVRDLLRWLGVGVFGVAAVFVLVTWLERSPPDRVPPDSTFAGGGYDADGPPEDEPGASKPGADAPEVVAPQPVLPDSAARVETVDPPPDALVPAGLVVPVAGIAPAELFDTYSDARGRGRVHDAIDILAPRGTPVLAATAGRILRLFTSARGGLTVYQLGPDERTVYYYAHLDAYRPGLAAGQTVAQGEAIATVGDSGNAVPGNTHLHFAMWTVADPARFWDGEPINPYPLLRGE